MKDTTFKVFDGAFNGAYEAVLQDLVEDVRWREHDNFEERSRVFTLAKAKFLAEHDADA